MEKQKPQRVIYRYQAKVLHKETTTELPQLGSYYIEHILENAEDKYRVYPIIEIRAGSAQMIVVCGKPNTVDKL